MSSVQTNLFLQRNQRETETNLQILEMQGS